MEQAVLPVLISYHTDRWIKVALRSYRRHFPDGMVLVIDNNPAPGAPGWTPLCEQERAWLRARPDVLLVVNEAPHKGHGTGMDCALAWCLENDVEAMLHFEPDCLITGTRWFEALQDALDAGAWMAGSHRKLYGPIHPAPSLWRTREVRASFEIQHRGDDVQHPRFRELFDLDWLVEAIRNDGGRWEWWRDHWDTAQKAWFLAAVYGKATLVAETPDFHHYWGGTGTHRDHPALTEDPRIVALLAEDGNAPTAPLAAKPPGPPPPPRARRPRFLVITPTIPGRESLLLVAIASVRAQDFPDVEHHVVGDGPCPGAEALCASMGVRYTGTPSRLKVWGANCRNLVLDEADADYVVFLDDDNLLFRRGLAALHEAATRHDDPPLLAQKILMRRAGAEPWPVLPRALPPTLGDWDSLNACVRLDVARRVRFGGEYLHDYHYIRECIRISGASPILVDEIGGVHL